MEKIEIVILHCSDLHYGFEEFKQASPDDKRLRQERIDGFFKIIETFPEGWKPSILVISGDIAWSGIKKEYETFLRDFLTPTLLKTGIKTENVILCIGNHDKDDLRSGHFNRPDDQNGTPSELYPSDLIPWLNDAFPAFLDACHSANIEKLTNTVSDAIMADTSSEEIERAGYVYGYRQIDGIDFLVLNSAFDCYHSREGGKTDYGLIRVGRQLVADAINQIPNNGKERLVITVLHHPFHWLHSSEKETITTIKNHSDIVLHGHEHKFDKADSKNCLILGSSTLSSNDTSDFGFELIKIIYSSEGLSPRVSILRGVNEKTSDEVEWAWKLSIKEEVLGKRDLIARREDELIGSINIKINKTVDDIVALISRYTHAKGSFDTISAKVKAGSVTIADYQNDLLELKNIFNEIKTKLDQLQLELGFILQSEEITFVKEDIENMLSVIAQLLDGLRQDPPSNRRNKPGEAVEIEQGETLKRTLRNNPGGAHQ